MRRIAVMVALGCTLVSVAAQAQELPLKSTADRPIANTGDIVSYRALLENNSTTNFSAATGNEIYLVEVPPRGFDVDLRTVIATRIASGGRSRIAGDVARFESDGSSRIVRFGPFELAAGESLEIRYHAVVGLDTRPGQFDNRIVAQTRGGVRVSQAATARVVLKRDSDFDRSLISGRVQCAAGKPWPDSFGVPGAKVYIDTGSYAVTDSKGYFHFSNVPAGARLLKLDAASVGGPVIKQASRMVLIGEGIPGSVRFELDCRRTVVSAGNLRQSAKSTQAKPSATVSGMLGTGRFTITRGGVAQSYELPRATLRASANSLRLAPASGHSDKDSLRFSATHSMPGPITRWALRISPAQKIEGPPLYEAAGTGIPPREFVWNGLASSGTPIPAGHYAVQLGLWSQRGEAQSAFALIAIEAPQAQELSWKASGLFSGSAKKPKASAALRKKVTELAAMLGPGQALAIDVHWDGSGDRIAVLARTQREALLIKKLLGEKGSYQVTAKGRGSLQPLVRSGDAAAKAKNRRVMIRIQGSSNALGPAPKLSRSPQVWVQGKKRGAGRYQVGVAGESTAIVVDVRQADGSRAALKVDPKRPTSTKKVRELKLVAHTAEKSLRVGDKGLPRELFELSVQVASMGGGDEPSIELESGQPKDPLDFTTTIPSGLSVKSWAIVIQGEGGELIHKESAKSPKGMLRISRTQTPLAPGTRYRYHLEIETQSGVRALSPPRYLVAGSKRASASELSIGGRLFAGNGALSAGTKNRLAAFVSRSRRLPPDTRFRLEVSAARKGGDSITQARVKVAARASRVRKYLNKLGLKAERIQLGPMASAAKDSIKLSPISAPKGKQVAELRINGKVVGSGSDKIEHTVTIPPNGRVLLDLSDERGARVVRSIVAPDEVGGQNDLENPRFDQPPPALTEQPSKMRVYLPTKGVPLRGRSVLLYGSAPVGERITVNGLPVVRMADPEKFVVRVNLPVGKSELVVQSKTKIGARAELKWPVEVTENELFAMALAEGIAATAAGEDGLLSDRALVPGMNSASTGAIGGLLLHGRLALYLKGRLAVKPLFDQVGFTAHVDTARERAPAGLFEQLLDPVRDAPVFGDSAQEVRDVNTRGKFYLRLTAKDSRLVVGAARVELGQGELFRYRRAIDGLYLNAKKKLGKHEVGLQGFATTQREELSSDINWFRSTGGSLYFLRHGFVLEGSEIITVIVRDRDTGLVVKEKRLARNHGYTIDYATGRVLLSSAMPSFAPSSWLISNSETSLTPESGDPVYLEIRYEHRDPEAADRVSGGVYASGKIADRVTVGAGYAGQRRTGQENYDLFGANASIVLGKKSRISAEIASSQALDGGNQISMDGGISFRSLDGTTVSAPDPNGRQLAYRATADIYLAEAFKGVSWLSGTRAQAFVQDFDQGFAAVGSAVVRGRLKFGGSVIQPIGDKDVVALRHVGEIANVPRIGPRTMDIDDRLVTSERATYLTTLRWSGKRGRFEHAAELAHQRLSSDAALADGAEALDADRYGGAVGLGYWLTKALRLRGSQQAMFSAADSDPLLNPIDESGRRSDDPLSGVVSNVGADVTLAEDVTLSGDIFQRWTGASAAQVGLATPLGNSGRVYVKERLGSYAGRSTLTTIVGASERLSESGGISYGEYQMENGVLGNRNRALLGLGETWQVAQGVGIALGYEHQLAFGGFLPDGTEVGDHQRTIFRGQLGLSRFKNFKAALRGELRLDRGPQDQATNTLTDSDPRTEVPPLTVADHGGTAIGAPLILPPGERSQLVLSGAADWAATEGNVLFARLRFANTLSKDPVQFVGDDEFSAQYYLEGTGGWAFRPLSHPWLHWVTRYSYLFNLRPTATPFTGTEARSHVLSTMGVIDLPWRFVVGTKLAGKWTDARTRVDDERIDTDLFALLAALRLGYRFHKALDISGELRQLILDRNAGDERRTGTLFELGYTVRDRIRMAVGYNFSRFSDDELRDLTRDGHGFFARVTGQY